MSFDKFNKRKRELLQENFAGAVYNQWKNFSDTVIRDSITSLSKIGFVRIDRAPVTPETKIYLAQNATASFLNIALENQDIVFTEN